MSEARARYHVKTKPGREAAIKANARTVAQGHRDASYHYEPPQPELVSALCLSQGWTQVQVAAMLHLNVSTVRRWMADSDQIQASKIPYAEWILLLIMSGNLSAKQIQPSIDRVA